VDAAATMPDVATLHQDPQPAVRQKPGGGQAEAGKRGRPVALSMADMKTIIGLITVGCSRRYAGENRTCKRLNAGYRRDACATAMHRFWHELCPWRNDKTWTEL
jgi:hypothetical protein